MALIKTLQHRVTCLDVPWLPPADVDSARMVNEIVLAEETDEVTPGHYTTHCDLYITAMEEIGADTSQIRHFINSLRQGFSADRTLASLSIPESTKTFVLSTCVSQSMRANREHDLSEAYLARKQNFEVRTQQGRN